MFDNPTILWMIFGFILIILEVAILPGVGMLFAGLGAVTTYVFLEFTVIDHNWLNEIIIFALASAIWAAILWLPLKHVSLSSKANSYNNIIGSTAIICEHELTPGMIGSVKWSGVEMKAKLTDTTTNSAQIDEQVTIVAIKDNILYVTKE